VTTAATNWAHHGWDGGQHFLAALSIIRVEQLIRESNGVALEPHGLTHTRHEALALLYFSAHGEMPLGKLSERLMVHPTSVTSTVDALERLGLVARVPHPADRRTVLARITEAGRIAMEESSQAMLKERFGLDALSDKEATQLFELLRKARAGADQLR
jgi:DNA-binding MarR family transcriptional regulator